MPIVTKRIPDPDPTLWEQLPVLPALFTKETMKRVNRKVTAKVYGRLAVCRELAPDDNEKLTPTGKGYNLFLVRGGLLVLTTDDENDALRIGQYLWDNYMMVFRIPDKEELLKAIPARIKEWLLQCKKERKCLPIKRP